MVMRARDLVYHLTCFSCASCDRPLTTGDHFGLRDRVVYCDAHYDVPLSDEFPLRNVLHSLSGPATNAAQNAFYNGVGATQKGRPRKRKSQAIDSDMCLMQLGESLC
ncbi:LIM/homeobox protein Lhx9 [Lamellibrachia satsuma]|nr:LIM/homeobox protein Lhx9 [Lamellibrachia satsuma]